MHTDEWLERHFVDAYKREGDQDEAVWRTLPFFGAAIVFSAALLGQVGVSLPTLIGPLNVISYLEYTLFGAAVLAFVVAFVFVWRAIRIRPYKAPPKETEILEFARSAETYFASSGSEADARVKTVATARANFIKNLAEAVTTNRGWNEKRLRYRSRAATAFMAAWTAGFVLAAILFTVGKLTPEPNRDSVAAVVCAQSAGGSAHRELSPSPRSATKPHH
jgi:hypothetical protein